MLKTWIGNSPIHKIEFPNILCGTGIRYKIHDFEKKR
jgi:hypothetical protein